MKRQFLALLLCTLLLLSTIPPAAASFTDITDQNTAIAAATLEGLGIVSGMGGQTFEPNGILTRAQMCKLVVNAMGLSEQVSTYDRKTLFSDVSSTAWYNGYVNLAYSKGIVNGYGNGTFGPSDSITYGQLATMLLRMLGYTSAEIGSLWPADYTAFCNELGLSEGMTLSPMQAVTRGQAAELLYNTLKTETNSTDVPYYASINGVSEVQASIILDTNASSGGVTGQLSACCVNSSGAAVEYFSQENTISSDLIGYVGNLLLNSAGKVIGFVPSSDRYEDVTVSTAKVSGITDADNDTHRITGSATVIIGEELYTWNSTGYTQINSRPGKTARIFYDDDGAVQYVYLRAGTASASTEAIIAETNTAAGELARKLGIVSSYSVTKNGNAASGADLAQYDVAYYDGATRIMCVSDYRVTGYIEAASPAVDGAETITVAGCTLPVLESAWETLADFKLGSRVTLLLTDDGKVAAASADSKVSAEMVGVLSTDGRSVALCGSGLVLTADEISADAKLQGRLVRVSPSGQNKLSCYAPSSAGSTGKLNIANETLGSYALAPSCAIYEQAGSDSSGSYVYSLGGEQGVSSSDLGEIYWTTSLSSSYVSWYHLNSAGQVDILLLKDVTGNCYEYGKIAVYSYKEGINLSSGSSMTAYNQAAKLTNSDYPDGGSKYLFTRSTPSGVYVGIALAVYNSSYQTVVETVNLTRASDFEADSCFLSDGDWYVAVDQYEIPVSDDVQVYISRTEQWLSGESGLLSVLSSGMTLHAYYDRTLTTGARVRVLVAQPD